MNKQKLEEILLSKNISPDSYSLSGGLPNEAYCLENTKSGWYVYYSERGIKREIGFFKNEEDACDCFYNEIKYIIES